MQRRETAFLFFLFLGLDGYLGARFAGIHQLLEVYIPRYFGDCEVLSY